MRAAVNAILAKLAALELSSLIALTLFICSLLLWAHLIEDITR